MTIRNLSYALILFLAGIGTQAGTAQSARTNQSSAWQSRPLSLADAINLALQHNGNILRGRSDLEAQYGIVVQTRAVALPSVQVNANYLATTATEQFPFPN